MSDLLPAATAALQIAEALYQERLRKLNAKIDLRASEATLEGERLRAEADLIAAVGGEKGLGSNAEAQKRALTLHVRTCEAVQYAEEYLEAARQDVGMAETRESYLADVFKVVLEAIPTGLALSQERIAQLIYPPLGRPSVVPEDEAEAVPSGGHDGAHIEMG